MSKSKLSLRGVQHCYTSAEGEVTKAIENIDLEVEKGEFLAIVGASGCGKSTLLNIMCGMFPPTRGEVLIDGESVEKGNHKIGYISQRKYQEYVRGWVEYFRLADMKGLLKTTDEWERRRIRAVYWKQWKKIKTKYRMLKALGMEHWKAKELACSRKGYWRMAKVLNQIFSKKVIAKLGYTSMLDYYLVVCEN